MDSSSLTAATASPSANLARQVELEKAMIDSAPIVKVQMGQVHRCHWCGQPISGESTEVEKIGSVTRLRCAKCDPSIILIGKVPLMSAPLDPKCPKCGNDSYVLNYNQAKDVLDSLCSRCKYAWEQQPANPNPKPQVDAAPESEAPSVP